MKRVYRNDLDWSKSIPSTKIMASSIINRLTFEPSLHRIDHKSKILSFRTLCVSYFIRYHFQITFLYHFQVIRTSKYLYLISRSLCIFRISDKILVRCHSTLKVPYEPISILWWCKGR